MLNNEADHKVCATQGIRSGLMLGSVAGLIIVITLGFVLVLLAQLYDRCIFEDMPAKLPTVGQKKGRDDWLDELLLAFCSVYHSCCHTVL